METRKNIYIAIFVITTIIASCLAVYFKIDSDKKSTQVIDNTSQFKENSSTDNTRIEVKEVEKIKKVGVTNFYLGSIAIVHEGNVYYNVSNNAYNHEYLKNYLYGEDVSKYLNEVYNRYTEYTFDNLDYHYYNNSFKGIKLNTSNVEKVYENLYGQMLSKSYGLILLNQDKTLSVISLYSMLRGKTDVKKLEGLTDINDVVTENQIVYAVKSNGEKIDLHNYIPSDFNQF